MGNSKLFLNGINIGSVKLGTSDVILYLGEELVYPLGSRVSITYDAATYNGTLQTAQNIVVTDESGNTLVENTDYVVTENNGGTNAGRYPIVITMMGQYEGTSRTSFVIDKVTPTVSAPTVISGLVYNSSQQALINPGSTDYGTLKYSIDGTDYSATIPSGTTAGTYTVYYKVDGDANINDVAANNITTSIDKVTPTVVAPTAKVVTYNTQAQALINAGSTNYGTLKYSLDNLTWSTAIPTATNYGSYTVYYKVDGDSNVNDVAAQSVACSINEKQVTATVELSQSTYTYNGSACEPTVTVKDGSTVIDPSEYTVTYSNNVNTGTATVTISDNVGGNYEVIGSATFTINRANVTYVAPTAVSSLVYDGNAQELLNAGTVTGGTMKYSSDDVNWSTDVPSGTNASSYTSYWKIDGDSNHNDIASSSIVTTIAKADSSLSFAVTKLTVGVEGTKSNLVTVNVGDGIVTYISSDPSIVTVDNNGVVSGVSSGDTIVTANISSTNNYNSATTSYDVACGFIVTAKFNVTSTDSPTKIVGNYPRYSPLSGISSIEIDGVKQSSMSTGYTFSSTGEHTVTYYLKQDSVPEYLLYYCDRVTSCTIDDGITTISGWAFYQCSGMTSINIPDSVTSIGNLAFAYCKGLTSVEIPSGVTSIFYNTFCDCYGLTSCTFAEGSQLKTIREKAFDGCYNLKSISIPSGVTNILREAFSQCNNLTSCTFAEGSQLKTIDTDAFYQCWSLTSITIPDSVTTIGENTFSYCYNLTSCTIGSGVTSIGNYAFYNCRSLASVTLPDSLRSIGSAAFSDCSGFTTITIPSGVTSIGNNPFTRCSGLTSIIVENGNSAYDSRNNCNAIIETSTNALISGCKNTVIPSDVTSIGNSAFNTCSNLTNINIPSGVTSIGNDAFSDCRRLTSIDIPDSVTSIGSGICSGCTSLTSCTIGSGVTSIGNNAFYNCSRLTSINIPSDVTSIGNYAFSNCSGLTSIDIPSGVTSIGHDAFSDCRRLTSIDIPDSVTSISDNAFERCTSLTSCTIGSGVTSIGDLAFYNCSSLTSITCNATTAPTIQSSTFLYVKTDGTLYVPIGSSGYDVWMGTGNYYLGKYNWTKVEQ